MPHIFWFYSITHAVSMTNAILGKFKDCLTSPFLLVHGFAMMSAHRYLYSLCAIFHHEKDGDQFCLKHQVHTTDGVIIGRSSTSNALLLYNLQNRQHYKPNSYCIGSFQLPGLVYPDLIQYGGLFCLLLPDDNLVLSMLTRPLICFLWVL
jgi:hypothetical protein